MKEMVDVIYEDEHLLAVNKPSGVVTFKEDPSQGTSLACMLEKRYPRIRGVGRERSGAVHRLDKETSGVVLFAKNENVLSLLQEEFFQRRVRKGYIALVFKRMKKDKVKISNLMGRSKKDRRKQTVKESDGRRAITIFRTIKKFENHTLLKVFPLTGRKHQIRCHLSHMGHPVAGEKLYRFKDQVDPPGLQRLFLHAKAIMINTPNGKKVIKAGLPEDLKKVIKEIK